MYVSLSYRFSNVARMVQLIFTEGGNNTNLDLVMSLLSIG